MALTLTEDLIRNRVGLQHDNLEDVKSLALPGTYHEKVVSLGSSLRKFTRLKHLDLSRNNISSLQGLENLQLLEKLNLYYNNIESLEELKRLKHNPNLTELDLRLNPVTRTEGDYRLYLIHMLPNLQRLDDRSVRDRERQGALIHFSSSQATEMTHHPQREEAPPRKPHPRVKHVRNMGSGNVLDDDDVELLDLIARTGGDLRQPRPITGSNTKEPAVEDYSLKGLKRLEPVSLDGPPVEMPSKKAAPAEIDEVMASYKKRYPNIPDVMVTSVEERQRRQDQNLEYADEAEAYNKFKSHGYFTPHPNTVKADEELPSQSFVETERDSYPAPPSRVQLERSKGLTDPEEDLDRDGRHQRSRSLPQQRLQYDDADSDFNTQPRAERYTEAEKAATDRQVIDLTSQQVRDKDGVTAASAAPSKQPVPMETPQSKLFLLGLLDLVDRYWNGSKSLHKNVKFKGLAYTAIEEFIRTMTDETMTLEIRQLQEELAHVRKENARRKRQEELAKSSLEDSAATETHLKASLQKAFTDVEMLKDRIQTYAQDNKRLQQRLQQAESYGPSQSAAAGSASVSVSQSQIDELQRQNEALQRELEKQRIQMKQFNQLQELSAMLQDSHKSLVQTNDHLLKELDETRQRHQHEVQQLNWSYDQLKRTMDGGQSTSRDYSASATLYNTK